MRKLEEKVDNYMYASFLKEKDVTFVYLHGFNSAFTPESEKIVTLKRLNKPVIGLNYNSFDRYDEIMDSLEAKVSTYETESIVFIGTSLGAFFASELGRYYGRPSVIINPCTDPYMMLGFALHIPMKNFITGVEETFTVHAKSSYLKKTISNETVYKYKPLLLVDLEDELLPMAKIFKELDFPKIAFSGGSHRFSHMLEALPSISEYVLSND